MDDARVTDVSAVGPLSARDEILARIRSANASSISAARALGAEEAWQQIPRDYQETSSLTETGRVELFAERLREYGAGVYSVQLSNVANIVAEILRKRNKQKMLLSSDVDPNWLPPGATFVADDDLLYAEIEAFDGVLTGCTVAIATTGTLGICHQSPRGRRALTLLPDYHLCVVDSAVILETVPQAMRALHPHRLQPITLISGPSATADIEMTRIQGVHGPRVLDVVIVA